MIHCKRKGKEKKTTSVYRLTAVPQESRASDHVIRVCLLALLFCKVPTRPTKKILLTIYSWKSVWLDFGALIIHHRKVLQIISPLCAIVGGGRAISCDNRCLFRTF